METFLSSLERGGPFTANIEMLAAERLMKLCQYLDDETKIKAVLDAIVARSAVSTLDEERSYYLGLLYHFTSSSNYEAYEERMRSGQIVGKYEGVSATSLYDPASEGATAMARGIPKLRAAASSLYAKRSAAANAKADGEPSEIARRYLDTLGMIDRDFAEREDASEGEIDEIQTAKLLARYYEDDHERPTPESGPNPDILLRNIDADMDEKKEDENPHEALEEGTPSAYYLWALRAGYHPTAEKISHAKEIGDPLTRFKIVDRAEYESPTATEYRSIGKIPPMTDARGEVYYRLIRDLKDAGENEEAERVRMELKGVLWDHLVANDNSVVSQFGGPENILVLAYTHRDKIDRTQNEGSKEDVEPIPETI